MPATLSSVRAVADPPAAAPHRALEHLLDDLAAVVMDADVSTYVARPECGGSGSVGEHVRHALDHVSALLALHPSATLSYDTRRRGTAVERDPDAAVQEIFRLKAGLARWSRQRLDAPVQVASLVAPGETVTGWSTLARELAFVVSHTIHHQAMIGLLLAIGGAELPDRFGYAPSTPAA